MITDIGSLTLAAAIPWAATAALNLTTACNLAAPNVQAQLTAMASFQPSVMISFTDLYALAQQIIANILAAINAIPPIPQIDLSVQAQMGLDLKVALQALLVQFQAFLAFALAFPSGSAHAYVYGGPKNAFGSELATALGPGSENCNALVLVATDSAGWVGMQAMFKTTP